MRKLDSLWSYGVAILGMSLALVAVPAPATAVTHAPCKHYAGTPYVDHVNDSVVTCKVGAVSLAVLRPSGTKA
jgi:hypothetical protein